MSPGLAHSGHPRAAARSWNTSAGWLRDPYRRSLQKVECAEVEDIGWGQLQVAAAKKKRRPLASVNGAVFTHAGHFARKPGFP
jgi:hypothetical protein